MTRPLVSVITGSWQRHDLLIEAIANVREQTYRPLEHVIVADGRDGELCDLVEMNLERYRSELRTLWGWDGVTLAHDVPIKFAELGRHWSSFLAASMSAVPFQVAQWLASGDYLVWLADDERMDPDHIESLVNLLEAEDADFVYASSEVWFKPGLPGDLPPMVIGDSPPREGTITNALYRAELLDYRGFRTHVGSASDWDQVEGWMQAGARWAWSRRPTIRHRVDKIGEGPGYRADRQPLRGHTERAE